MGGCWKTLDSKTESIGHIQDGELLFANSLLAIKTPTALSSRGCLLCQQLLFCYLNKQSLGRRGRTQTLFICELTKV